MVSGWCAVSCLVCSTGSLLDIAQHECSRLACMRDEREFRDCFRGVDEPLLCDYEVSCNCLSEIDPTRTQYTDLVMNVSSSKHAKRLCSLTAACRPSWARPKFSDAVACMSKSSTLNWRLGTIRDKLRPLRIEWDLRQGPNPGSECDVAM